MKIIKAAFIFLLIPLMNSCIMMPFTMGPMLFKGNRNAENPDVIAAVNTLVQKSSGRLMDNRGPYEKILLGKIETDNKSISPRKLRTMILKRLRSENRIQVFDGDKNPPLEAKQNLAAEPMYNEVLAVLDVQVYYNEGRILMAQQLVDLRSHRIYWSDFISEPVVKP